MNMAFICDRFQSRISVRNYNDKQGDMKKRSSFLMSRTPREGKGLSDNQASMNQGSIFW